MVLTIIALGIVGFTIMLYIISKKKYGNEFESLDKKEYMAHSMMFIGAFVFQDLIQEKINPKNYRKLYEQFQQLYGKSEAENKVVLHYYNKITVAVIILFIMSFLTGIYGLGNGHSSMQAYNEIERPEFGEGKLEKNLQVKIGKGEEAIIEDIEIVVQEKIPTHRQVEEAIQLTKERINRYILGGNTSLDHITDNLKLYKYDPATGAKITWYSEDIQLVNNKGTVSTKSESVQKTILIADITVAEQQAQHTIEVVIYPKKIVLTKEEKLKQELQNTIQQINHGIQYVEDDKVVLPSQLLEDNEIVWKEMSTGDNKLYDSYVMLGIGLFLTIAVYVMLDERVKTKVEEKRESIKEDFPIFINNYVLLINCGDNAKIALEKVLNAYKEKNKEKTIRPLYSELTTTYQEMESHIDETDAFERFGKRCRMPEIMKFASLMAQTIRKGNSEVAKALNEIVKEAWENKKTIVKEKGSKASTRLLLPMMIMLLAVLILVMAPAIFSFGNFI